MGTEEKSEFYKLAEEESLKETRVSGGRKCARTNKKKKYINFQEGQSHLDVHKFISATGSSYTEVSSISSSSRADNYFSSSISSNISSPVHGISNLVSLIRTDIIIIV